MPGIVSPERLAAGGVVGLRGVLLDDDWCRFFAAEHFSVGLSLDGPPALHDVYRVTKDGRPTHRQAMQGYRLLRNKKQLEHVVTMWDAQVRALSDAEVLLELAEEVSDEESAKEAAGTVDKIRWMTASDVLLVGTAGAEVAVQEITANQVLGPENVKYDPETRTPIIMDFGLIKSLKPGDTPPATQAAVAWVMAAVSDSQVVLPSFQVIFWVGFFSSATRRTSPGLPCLKL